MWFRNIRVLQCQEKIAYEPETLALQFNSFRFRSGPKSLPSIMGWVPPIGEIDAPIFHAQDGFIALCLQIEEKIVPASVIKEKLNEKIKILEALNARKIYRDEKERLKDEIYHDLLTQAFTKSTRIYAYIDCKKNWLIINTASQKRYTQFLSLLNKSLNQPFHFPELVNISQQLTAWLNTNEYPSALIIDDACVLKHLGERGSQARFKREDLLANKVLNFLKEDYHVVQLSLEWRDQIRFTLKDDFSINGINFLEAVKDLTKDGLAETVEERFAADFCIMAETLQNFLDYLLPYFSSK